MTTDDVARLIQATRTFVDIAQAPDDLGALDALRGNIYASKRAGLFSGLFEIARYLCDSDLVGVLDLGAADAALAAAGLDRRAVEMAKIHAQRFLGVSEITCYTSGPINRRSVR